MNNLINNISTIDKFANENPRHLNYINEFRTKQCVRFQDHKCAYHKPFNCFNWHFPNQRRRVPILKDDGTFNYNPDLYCNDYDVNTGQCVNGNSCQYVHLNAGDTERRYHPRYFKTGMCIYETTSEGVCGKNGIHCAFAHEESDLRQAVYDIRESSNFTNNLSAQLEKERVLTEDPIWNLDRKGVSRVFSSKDKEWYHCGISELSNRWLQTISANEMDYVLAFYKTKECKKLPKTCRQGYACPFYHNSKDRRRIFIGFHYQSQPCTSLKPNNDEWLDIVFCQLQDNCHFSHSRTEQQFHPEIFKSSKCNDMIRDGYCPRGPFCAFAHNDSEMNNGQYNHILREALLKHLQILNSDSTNIFRISSPCLNDSRSLNNVFQSDSPISSSLTTDTPEDVQTPKMNTSNWDILNSSFSEGQGVSIKQILERALSDSSNVAQMTDLEIQRLPELLMKFTNGENSLTDVALPIIAEWIDQDKKEGRLKEESVMAKEKSEKLYVKESKVQEKKKITKQDFSDRNERISLHKEILDTKNKLKRAEEDLKTTRNQINLILIQLQNFLNALDSLEINDHFKKKISIEISVIVEKLETIKQLNESCPD